jgi:hypothetical protein
MIVEPGAAELAEPLEDPSEESNTSTETAALAPATPPSCSQPDCTDPVVSTYTWDWGESGACCARHQFILNQRAKNLKRRISFVPIAAGAPPPMLRDERVKFRAEILARDDELAEVRGRTAKLYDQNQTLVAELKRLTAINAEQKDQLTSCAKATEAMGRQQDELLLQLHKTKDELVRVQTLNDALRGGVDADHGDE